MFKMFKIFKRKPPKYRIRKIILPSKKIVFYIERKSIFGFWYNPDNIDACITGEFDTYNEAYQRIQEKLTPIKSEVVFET